MSDRSQLTDSERAVAAREISEKVFRSVWFQRSRNIACYLSVGDEVSTWEIVARANQMKKRVFAPKIKKNRAMEFCEVTTAGSLQRNKFGIFEPVSEKSIDTRLLDVVITPLVSFDADYNRIGMGGGYFDRTFAYLKHRRQYFRPKLIGIAFACQKTRNIPANPWDIRLFDVITD